MRNPSGPGVAQLYLREELLRQGCEALLRATRALSLACEEVLTEHGLGPAHHRTLFLIAGHPGVTMSELLRILHITKQSLNRVLNELAERRLIERRSRPSDRRLRLIYLTAEGQFLEQSLFAIQKDHLTQAYLAAGGPAVDGFRRVLSTLAEGGERHER